MADNWIPIAEAPKDGRPLWVRGWNWGKESEGRHYGWAFFNDGAWQWERDGSIATHLTDWMWMT
jgi:hypothetical protein